MPPEDCLTSGVFAQPDTAPNDASMLHEYCLESFLPVLPPRKLVPETGLEAYSGIGKSRFSAHA